MKTEYRYLAQDLNGEICLFASLPEVSRGDSEWITETGDVRVEEFFSGSVNKNWEKTLIDLTKDDFKIEDGILTKTTDPHKEMRREWEESGRTKIVQYKAKYGAMAGKFRDYQMISDRQLVDWDPEYELRIKPEIIYCRMFEVEDMNGVRHITMYSHTEPVSSRMVVGKFIRWVGDVQKVECQ